jgi:uncharacterized membrane protein YecN with MAPEG domain
MVPITSLYAALLALLVVVLSINVVRMRGKTGVSLGHGEHPGMLVAVRAHGNAVEYLPIALILMACYELEHGGLILLHVIGIFLVLGRIAHAIGLARAQGTTVGRASGYVLTILGILIAAAALLMRVAEFSPALFMAH